MSRITKLRGRWNRRKWRRSTEMDRYNGLEPLILITGGSEGIGLAIAREFLETSATLQSADNNPANTPEVTLLLVARDPSKLARAVRDLSASYPSANLMAHHIDLRNADNRRDLEAYVASLGYYVDTLVNSAGSGLSGPFISHSAHNIRDLIELNVTAVTDLCRRFLPGMVARGRGGILNVSSLAGMVPGPYQTAYYASKAYLNALGAGLAQESSGYGVQVTTLAPGAVNTDFHQRMEAEGSAYLKVMGVASPQAVARAGVAAYFAGRRYVVPGLVSKVSAVALKLTPQRLSAPLMALLLKRPKQSTAQPERPSEDNGTTSAG